MSNLEEIKMEISRIKLDLLAGRVTMPEAIDQMKYINYDQSALYNALYSSKIGRYIN